MSPSLRSYLDKHCTRHPAAVMPILDLTRDFRAWLPPAERRDWTRQRLVSELLAHGFTCGLRDRTWHVAGLAPVGTWHTVNGKLELAHA